jgi:hypothetical protein
MSAYLYDALGFYAGEAPEGAERSTSIVPPDPRACAIFDGNGWATLDPGSIERVRANHAANARQLAAARLALILTGITTEPPAGLIAAPRLGDITCKANTALCVVSEVRDVLGNLVPVTDRYRMPLRATDGREKVVLAEAVAGVVTINVTLRDSGVRYVTEDMINAALPPGLQMAFGGFTVYVLEE